MNILLAFVKKELIQALRDRKMRFILFGAPIIQLIIFGYVVTTTVKNIAIHVVDLDRSAESRGLVSSFTATGYFTLITVGQGLAGHPVKLLETNKIKAAIIIPAGFIKTSKNNIQVLIDGSDGNTATIIKGYVEQIFNGWRAKRMPGSGAPAIKPEIKILYNPELKSTHFMVPGLLGLILLMLTAILSAMAITREKELGTLEQIRVSPLQRWEFVVGKTLPFVLVGFIDVLLILGVAKLLFDIPVRGSLVLLFIAAVLFLFTSLGIGLIAATVSKTQAQAMLTVMPVMMPAFLLSGLFFPIASIPAALRWIPYINPITYFLIVVRGILLKGSEFGILYREILVLTGFGIIFMTISSVFFSKRLE